MIQENFVFSGFGGQGVMFAGQLLAYAAMDAGLEVTWIPSYGPEMRGGTAHCYVVVSEKPIGSPLVSNPGVGIVFNNPSFEKYDPLIVRGGLLAVNSSLVKGCSERDDIHTLYIPATEIADEIGNVRLANIVLLGSVLQVHPVLTLDTLREALKNHIPSHRRNLLDVNLCALDKGADYAHRAQSLLVV